MILKLDAVQADMKELEPSYFLEAMDLYRERFRRVIFIYVSDDPGWARRRILPRVGG